LSALRWPRRGTRWLIVAGLIDQLAPTWDSRQGHGQPRRDAPAGIEDAARAIDREIVRDHDKTGRAVAGFIDGAAERRARMWRINEAGDVPGRVIAGVIDVDPRG
jgi:hypothetical protein